MKLPRKVDYACRVLSRLSLRGDQLARVEELATAESISGNYLVQILNELRNAGLVESRRGRRGGYRLGRPSSDITLRDVVNAIEGNLIEIPGPEETPPNMRVIWERVAQCVENELDSVSLKDWSDPDNNAGDWVI